jgi:replicative DNA helicase
VTVKFDLEFETQILAQAIRDDAFVKSAIRICEQHHFGTREHAWIWGVISDVWKKYHERASGKIIVSRAKIDHPDHKKRLPYLKLASKLARTKPRHPKAALEELSRFIREVNLQLALEKSADALSKGNLETAELAVSRLDRTVCERKYTLVPWIEGFTERQDARRYEREHPGEFKVIPTGWKTLDKALNGGMRAGELGIIMGTTGRGKSIAATNVTMASVRRLHNTLYIVTEMSARQVAQRQDAIWTGMRYDQFKTWSFDAAELRVIAAALKRSLKRFTNKLHIASIPVRSSTIIDVRYMLDDLSSEHDFTPDIIVFDSGDHLRSTDKSLDSYRLRQADVYWELKRLAEEDGFIVWSTVQAGKEYANVTATSEATSESYDKGRIADAIISINDPNAGRKSVELDEDESDDDVAEIEGARDTDDGIQRLEMFLAKYRDGRSKIKIPLLADFARMKISEAGGGKEEDDAI